MAETALYFPAMNQPNLARFLGTPGAPVPPVDAADLKAVWNVYEEAALRDPSTQGRGIFVGNFVLESACSPGADPRSVIYRTWMLRLLEAFPDNPLPSLSRDGKLPEAVFNVAAKMPLEWMAVGVPWNGAPFNVEAFVQEVQKEQGGV